MQAQGEYGYCEEGSAVLLIMDHFKNCI